MDALTALQLNDVFSQLKLQRPAGKHGKNMPSISWQDYKFSIDLVAAGQKNYDFLTYMTGHHDHIFSVLALKNAIRRYEMYWLPLIAQTTEQEDRPLIPPPDVHWIWYCHMLAPTQYRSDCTGIVGKVIDHKLLPLATLKRISGRALWQAKYPKEPWCPVASLKEQPDLSFQYKQESVYGLLPAAQRMRDIAYQVSLPHYRSLKFLGIIEDRYRKFLNLQHQHVVVAFSPSFATDFIWHTHMLHPLAYAHDMELHFGHIMQHDDSDKYSHTSTGLAKMGYNTAAMQLMWHQLFKSVPNPQGCMHRGDRPVVPIYSDKLASDELDTIIHIADTEAFGVENPRSQSFSFSFKQGDSNTALGSIDKSQDSVGGRVRSQRIVKFQPKKGSALAVQVISRSSLESGSNENCYQATMRSHDLLASTKLDKSVTISVPLMRPKCHSTGSTQFAKQVSETQAKLTMTTHLKIDASWAIRHNHFVRYVVMQNGTLKPENPKHAERHVTGLYELCMEAAKSKSGFEADPTVILAWHKLVEQKTRNQYDLVVLHNAHAVLSLILLMYESSQQVITSASLIGPEALPAHDDVENDADIPTLSAPCRAVIIRNVKGDFAVLSGQWQSSDAADTVGEFKLNTYFLKASHQQAAESIMIAATSKFLTIGDVTMDIFGGTFKCVSSHPFEHAVAVIAAGVVFNLCNPDRARREKSKYKRIFPCVAWPFMVAAGYGHECPSNKYLLYCRKKAKSRNSMPTEQMLVNSEQSAPFFAHLGLLLAEACWQDEINDMYMISAAPFKSELESTSVFMDLLEKLMDSWDLVAPTKEQQADKKKGSWKNFWENFDSHMNSGRSAYHLASALSSNITGR